MQLKHIAQGMLLTAAWLAASAAHSAEPWPKARPIQLIVSAPPGGGTDTFARVFADKLGKVIGQTLVIENKPGANGLIGNDAVARAAPDGYTLGFTYAATLVGNKWLNPKLPHDVQKDLLPIAQVGSGGNFLVVTPSFPARTFAEFIKEVKAHPDQYSYASWGLGSGGHIAMEAIKQQTGIALQHVPYKGVQPTLIDLKGGRLQIAFVDVTTSLPMIAAGDLIPLAVSGTSRTAQNKDIPTLNELGVTYNVDAWYGLFGPAKLAPEIVQKLNTAANLVLKEPEMLERFTQMNMPDPPIKTSEEFRQTIAHDIDSWGQIIKAANISLD